MLSVTRKFPFEYAHRLLGHQGKCRFLHGHSGVAEITVVRWEEVKSGITKLDELGMVADFGLLKEKMGEWINAYLDHNIILHKEDPLALLFAKDFFLPVEGINLSQKAIFERKAPYIMEMNPTSENIALELMSVCGTVLPGYLKTTRVRVHETVNCCAEISDGLR